MIVFPGKEKDDDIAAAVMDAIGVIAASGSVYITYRIVRMIPSVLFPPSMIPNLIAP